MDLAVVAPELPLVTCHEVASVQ